MIPRYCQETLDLHCNCQESLKYFDIQTSPGSVASAHYGIRKEMKVGYFLGVEAIPSTRSLLEGSLGTVLESDPRSALRKGIRRLSTASIG